MRFFVFAQTQGGSDGARPHTIERMSRENLIGGIWSCLPIDPKAIDQNVFSLIREVDAHTAGTVELCNTMTASWGGLGVIWGSVGHLLYPPQRYTKEFVDREE